VLTLQHKQREKQLSILFDIVVLHLIKKIEDKTATYQDFEVARKLLADNGITAEPKSGQLLEGLEDLPFDSQNITLEDPA
jgi:hypothetical protein